MGRMLAKFPKFKEQWGNCQTCDFDVPVSRLRFSGKYGWQCTGWPGANCADPRPDRDDYLAARRFPSREGTRTSRAPTVTTTDGAGTDVGYGQTDYGSHPYGKGGST